MRIQNIFLLVITLLVSELYVAPVSRCFKPRSVSEELKNSTAVFSAQAVAEEYRPVSSKEVHLLEGGERLVIKFAVERWWKGSGDGEIVLYTSVVRLPNGTIVSDADDFTFGIGERYLIYAYGIEDRLGTSDCRRTKLFEKAEEDLRELGEGRLPEKKQGSTNSAQP